MGFLESMALLVALGGASYVTVYYVLPALQQMSIAPYYYMQAAAAAQQQQPIMIPAPVTQAATIPPEAAGDVTDDEPEPIEDTVEDVIEDELEDAGLVKDPPDEDKNEEKTTTPTSSKKEMEEFKKKRAEEGKEAAAKAKASGFKKEGPSPIGSGWIEYQFPTSIGIKVVIVDEYDIVRDQYYT